MNHLLILPILLPAVVGAVMLALANLSRMGRWTSPYTINTGAMDVDPRATSGKEQG